jgi:hypothetical protein
MGDGPFVRPKATKVGNVKLPHVVAESQPEAVRVDDATTYQYFGFAAAGSSESDAVWKISRWTVANPQAMMWADGNTAYDNIWTDRASLTYT